MTDALLDQAMIPGYRMIRLRQVNLIVSVVLVLITFYTTTSAQSMTVRKQINFDRDWKFHLGNASDPSKDFNYGVVNMLSKSGKAEGTAADRRFVDSTWRTIQLPHDWAAELPFQNSPNLDVMAHGYKPVGGLFPLTSIGWYRKHFSISRSDSANHLSIRFDGIFRNSKVWINGFYLGTHESGYTGMTYDLTDYLNFDGENVIVVRADASQYEGWFYEGAGIYRHTWLEVYPRIHVNGASLVARTAVTGTNATVQVEAMIENFGVVSGRGTAYTYIASREGKIIARGPEQPFSLPALGQISISQKLTLSNPEWWSLENTYRYKAGVVILSGAKTVDLASTRFGVRTIAFDKDKGLLLNGKNIKIFGVNCHQDHAGVGSALPDYLQYYRIRLLKEMGANAYRASHNPPTPELLEACDSLGMLVMDETRLLSASPEYMKQWEDLIIRDRNHPSIFIWSIGNEEGYVHTNPYGKRLALKMMAKQMELDPTRTSTYAADLANVFQGVNEVIPVRGFNYRIMGVDPYHRDHPDQPIVGTEMGSTVTTRGIYRKDTIAAYLPDEDITFPWWANTAEQWWLLCAERPWWMGGFVWTGFDYRGEPTPYQWPNISSHFGVMDVCGFPKNIYYYYQSWWTDKDVLHLSPHWNWVGKEGQVIPVWVNTNADDVELFLNGNSLGKKTMPRNSHLVWDVPFAPGTLAAIAHKKGRILEAKIQTTGEAKEVAILPQKTTLLANGVDATVINVRVVDRQGRDVPDANQEIVFTLSGKAKFIGVGNGDPSSHEPDQFTEGTWKRKLFNGKCQIILQAGLEDGIVKVFAKSNGLEAASSEIHLIHTVVIPPLKSNKVSLNHSFSGKMIGADISFLPELENKGVLFRENGVRKDAIEILRDHGFNYIRLRIFANPAADKGYSPNAGFCDLDHTRQMAARVKKAGLKWLLDFHYSDYWADPQQQNKPASWKDLDFGQLEKKVRDYTKNVLFSLKEQGTLPDIVQIGNEINHGMLWPDGHVGNLDSLARLVKAGIEGVNDVDPSIRIMMHVALGGQYDETRFFLDQMIARGVKFDIIGLSYYPRWHGTLDDLKTNLDDLIQRYPQPISVVEYSYLKQEVNDMVFDLPGNRGIGTCIWEPLSTWESIFDKAGNSNDLLLIYDELKKKYMDKNK